VVEDVVDVEDVVADEDIDTMAPVDTVLCYKKIDRSDTIKIRVDFVLQQQ
jgi:hypothetical protein